MNKPPYIISDVFTDIVAKVATSTGMAVKSHYGYVTELNETLNQMSKSPDQYDKKFPLIWLKEPFTITSRPFMYGEIDELVMFIMTDSKKDYKSYQRKQYTFKPILYPLKDALIKEMGNRPEFSGYAAHENFKITDHYYWGEEGRNVLNDIVDTIAVRFQRIPVKNNKNCITN